jgi:hypothetical protein
MIHVLFFNNDPQFHWLLKKKTGHGLLFSVKTTPSSPPIITLPDTSAFGFVVSGYPVPDMNRTGLQKQIKESGNLTSFIFLTSLKIKIIKIRALIRETDFDVLESDDLESCIDEPVDVTHQADNQKKGEKFMAEEQDE